MTALRFTAADADIAHAGWGCNCGPAALAAVCGLTLDDVRLAIDRGFPRRGYINPSQMFDAIECAGWEFRGYALDSRTQVLDLPNFGVARIQWEGPWTEPGWPITARYRYTHWVAGQKVMPKEWRVFDINAMELGGWIGDIEWRRMIVPAIVRIIPRASGKWHITHRIEMRRPHRVQA